MPFLQSGLHVASLSDIVVAQIGFARISTGQASQLSHEDRLLDCPGKVDGELADATKLLRSRIALAVPRKISAAKREVWHVYTDACYEKDGQAGIGGVLIDESGTLLKHFGAFLSDDQPSVVDIVDNETIIAELEMLVIWIGVVMFEKVLIVVI